MLIIMDLKIIHSGLLGCKRLNFFFFLTCPLTSNLGGVATPQTAPVSRRGAGSGPDRSFVVLKFDPSAGGRKYRAENSANRCSCQGGRCPEFFGV